MRPGLTQPLPPAAPGHFEFETPDLDLHPFDSVILKVARKPKRCGHPCFKVTEHARMHAHTRTQTQNNQINTSPLNTCEHTIYLSERLFVDVCKCVMCSNFIFFLQINE